MQNSKTDRVKFVTEVKELLLQKGFKLNTKNYYDYIYESSKNEVYLSLHDQSEHKSMYSLFSRFKDCTKLSGNVNSKHNLHCMLQNTNPDMFDVDDAINKATDYINDLVGACNQDSIERIKPFFAGTLPK